MADVQVGNVVKMKGDIGQKMTVEMVCDDKARCKYWDSTLKVFKCVVVPICNLTIIVNGE